MSFYTRKIGQGLMLLALGFIAYELVQQWAKISEWHPSLPELITTLCQAFIYGVSLLLLAYNWHLIVDGLCEQPIARKSVLRSYTQTQIAKYIPGNVVHFIGRHIYLRQFGISNRNLGIATLLEIAIMPFSAAMVVFACLIFEPLPTHFPLAKFLNVLALPFLVAAGLSLIVAAIIPIWYSKGLVIRNLAVATLSSCLFFAIMGISFWVTLSLFFEVNPGFAIAGIVIAWLVGFMTPGSPGGLGTREAALLILFRDTSPEDAVLLAAFIFRAITVSGDVICYYIGKLLYR